MKHKATAEIRMTSDETHKLIEGLIRFGKHRVLTPEGVEITFIRETGGPNEKTNGNDEPKKD